MNKTIVACCFLAGLAGCATDPNAVQAPLSFHCRQQVDEASNPLAPYHGGAYPSGAVSYGCDDQAKKQRGAE